MKKPVYLLEQIACFQQSRFIQATALESLVASTNSRQHKPYLAILRRMTSAWAEHQKKAVLFYLGTETTQDKEQRQLLQLQAEMLWAAVAARRVEYWLLSTRHKTGDNPLI